MNLMEEYLKAMEFLQDYIHNIGTINFHDNTVIYTIPGEDDEFAIRVTAIKTRVSFMRLYSIEVSANYTPYIKREHLKELRKLQLVVSNSVMQFSIHLSTRIVGKGSFKRRFYGTHLIPVEYRNCLFEPCAKFSKYSVNRLVRVENCVFL